MKYGNKMKTAPAPPVMKKGAKPEPKTSQSAKKSANGLKAARDKRLDGAEL